MSFQIGVDRSKKSESINGKSLENRMEGAFHLIHRILFT